MTKRADPPVVARGQSYGSRAALRDEKGTFTYNDLLEASGRVAGSLLGGERDLHESRVAYIAPSSFEHVAAQWGIWRAGGVAVPLPVSYPPPELSRMVEDADVATILVHEQLAERIEPVAATTGVSVLAMSQALEGRPGRLPNIDPSRRAMMVYTSGTTGRPKGVVTTHAKIKAQVQTLIEAWEWKASDHILLVLPLHHLHGIINVLTCALWSGARCTVLPAFDADQVWEHFIQDDLTLFMAVPTIYRRLIDAWQQASEERRVEMQHACSRFRLMVSGSAALPTDTFAQWRAISGDTLLERYGMTEIGMALSNQLHEERLPGYVGVPLPGVQVRLVDDDGNVVDPGSQGEIEVKSSSVFLEYWHHPDATDAAFHLGWFRTGDMATVEDGNYRILGRKSGDIIKSGGYKISALEIEDVLREHPDIRECAVVGIADPEWGERVVVAAEVREGCGLDTKHLRVWAKRRLAPYKVPTVLKCVDTLPRNALGKVTKTEVIKAFERTESDPP